MVEEKEWFEDWFDSPYYDLLYEGRDEAEAATFIDNLLAHVLLKPRAKVLDLPCGKGRHSVYLHQKGYRVTGADLSKRSIAYAKQFETTGLSFCVHDMREPFAETGFNLVLNLFTSFGYFESLDDNLKVLQSVWNVLAVNGRFVLDYFNGEKVKANLVASEEKTRGEVNFLIKKKIENGIVVKDIQIKVGEKSQHFQEKVQLFTLPDFENLFAKANLKIVEVAGDYSLNPFNSQISDRLIIIATK